MINNQPHSMPFLNSHHCPLSCPVLSCACASRRVKCVLLCSSPVGAPLLPSGLHWDWALPAGFKPQPCGPPQALDINTPKVPFTWPTVPWASSESQLWVNKDP